MFTSVCYLPFICNYLANLLAKFQGENSLWLKKSFKVKLKKKYLIYTDFNFI